MNDVTPPIDPNFLHYGWTTGFISDCDPKYPTRLWAFNNEPFEAVGGAFFGYVDAGYAYLSSGQFDGVRLAPGSYFAVNGRVKIVGGRGILIERLGGSVLPMIGGPVEPYGRLSYIDGCTDSLIIPPVKKGDACLNLLYFPPGIDQTQHTHPSDRIGMVTSGCGECETPNSVITLYEGMIFRIPAEAAHKFRTHREGMLVIAYHPDSDFGPEDDDHPMINRTIVDGVSAKDIEAIKTKNLVGG